MAKKPGTEKFSHEVWLEGMKRRVDTVMKDGKKVISRKATQLSDVTEDTAKKYIDEVAEYRGKGVQNPARMDENVTKIADDAEAALSVPKQKEPIPQTIKDHATEKKLISYLKMK